MSGSYHGELCVIGMNGSENFVSQVDYYLRQWRQTGEESFLISAEWPRFGTGEGKCLLRDSMRGRDVYVYADVFNYGVKYKMYGMECPMSPDDHFQDLKRLIGALASKSRRVSVIMPMLYAFAPCGAFSVSHCTSTVALAFDISGVAIKIPLYPK